ncbi:MAG: carbon-nitrogen hydrolase family protein [Gammaproteobacteria bacterium]|nr:carbon-nitrogen hydrolase family protein [Gammaproteobacteria bacterium]MBU1489164.1 carbon-nitrogen hydrolase family protein [Gammaproteobacteria bacterium]MBU2065277.1 carbon-nitrogen hydrolase family protein [Gammaproteobacteria bacterium]MBU2139409.1 carbon-nitrogen hydrolase family protein [Gammaproteobacteria bacterium]MBU2218597.1 carbon-nitrogen hydrolase family protein [Gammaproteobacteria bacterium]
MRLALWQTQGFPADVDANLKALEPQMQAAAAAGAQVLLCPELWLGGYQVPGQMAALAEAADGPAAQRLADLCREHGLALCYGYAERHPAGGKPYNSAQLIDAQGQRLANYRKAHLFGAMERELFTPGDGFEAPVLLNGWRVALLICFDVEFPEAVRSHALAGAELVLIPTALTPEYRVVPELIVPTRAVENQLFVAYCNHSGVENGLAFLGGSCVAAPDGERLGALAGGEGVLVVDLDRSQRESWRERFPYLEGRRPALYGELLKR